MFLNSELFGHQRGQSNKGYKLVQHGDLILSTQNLHLGNANVNMRFEHGMVSPAYKTYRIVGCSSELLSHWVKSDKAKEFFFNATTVGASVCRRNVEWETLYNQIILLPQAEEQSKIANFLSLISERIEKQQNLVSALKSYKRGLSIAIFDKKSLITNSTIRTVTLGSFCNIIMGQSPDSASYNTEGVGLPLVQGNADMKNGITTPTKYTSNPTKTCDAGEIILSVRAPVGSVGVSNQKICLGRGVCSISSPNNDYILQYLKHCEKQWRTLEQGGTFTAISGDDIKNFPLMLPNDTEIENIVRLLKGLDNLISRQELQLEKLIYCKQGLLQSLFI